MSSIDDPGHSSARPRLSARLGFGIVFLLTILLYLPSLASEFVWDDAALVQRDPLIRSWRLTSEVFDHFLFLDATGSDFYRPLQRLSYLVDYHLFGLQPWGYHLTSALVHALAAGMLFLLAREMIRRFAPAGTDPTWPSLATACLWAIHPLQTSAVAYISGRADPLAALFCFLGLIFALRALSNPLVNWREFVAGTCFLLAALSKEMGLVGFGLWFLTLLFARAAPRRLVTSLLISAAAVGLYATMRTSAQRVAPPVSLPSTLAERPALAAAALGEYAQLIIAPRTLRMERGQERWPKESTHNTIFKAPTRAGCATGAMAAVLFMFWVIQSLRHRRRLQSLALTLAAVSYLPISNLITLNATVAEHWLYLPLAFTLLAASVDVARLLAPWRQRRPAWAVAATATVTIWGIALATRTWMREGDWSDQWTFITRTIEDGGNSPRMYINRAQELMRRGDRAAARADYELALKLAPGQPFALLGMGGLDYAEGHYETAREHLQAAGLQAFYRPSALDSLALVRRAEHSGDGLAEIQEALNLAPDNWPLTRRKIRFLIADGKPAPAVRCLRAFINEQPFRAESWLLLAELMRDHGNLPAAGVALQRAAERDVHLGERQK